MATRPSKAVLSALLSKGFKEDDSGHHRVLWFYVKDMRTSIRTHVSHNPPKDLDRTLIGKMARQCQLKGADFLDLIDCPMTGKRYLDHLVEGGHITVDDG